MCRRTLLVALALLASPLALLVWSWPAAAADLGTPTATCTVSGPPATYSGGASLNPFGISCSGIPDDVGMLTGYVQGTFDANGNSSTQGVEFRLMDNEGGSLPSSLTVDCTTSTCSSGTGEDGTQVVNSASAQYGTQDFYSTQGSSTPGLILYGLGSEGSSSTNEYTCDAGATYICGSAYWSDDYQTASGFFTAVIVPTIGLGLAVIIAGFASGWILSAVQHTLRMRSQ